MTQTGIPLLYQLYDRWKKCQISAEDYTIYKEHNIIKQDTRKLFLCLEVIKLKPPTPVVDGV